MNQPNQIHLFLLNRRGNGINRTRGYADVVHGVRTLNLELDRNAIAEYGEDDPCIVLDDLPNIEQVRFVECLANAVSANPDNAYTYAGYRFEDVHGGILSPVQKTSVYNRMPFTPRYRENDNGTVDIDALSARVIACSAKNLLRILDEVCASDFTPEYTSVAMSELGMKLKCVDPPFDWSGLPKQSIKNTVAMRMDAMDKMPLFAHDAWHVPAHKDTGAKRDENKVAVIVTTHNRTDTAKLTLQSLVSRLKYDNLEWIIADDRSDAGHLQALVDQMHDLGIDVKTTVTTEWHYGLGASLNNALKLAFKTCDIVLTTEDDWFLQRDLDLRPLVEIAKKNENVGTIRLGSMYKADDHLLPSSVTGYKKVTNGPRTSIDKTRMLLNLQVAVRHKRLYDKLGYYVENRKPDDVESNMNERFCYATDNGFKDNLVVLWPDFLEKHTLDGKSNPFVHFGESTIGHKYAVPAWLEGKTRIEDVSEERCVFDDGCTTEVAFVSDSRGKLQLSKVVRSIRNTNDGRAVNATVLAYDPELAYYAENVIPKTGSNVSVHVKTLSEDDRKRVDESATIPSGTKYMVPPVGCAKFLLGKYINAPKVLYIDTDTLVRKPLHSLYSINLEGNIVGAVPDPGSVFLKKMEYPLIAGHPWYFNSGVLLLDLDKFRDGGFEQTLFHRKRMQPGLQFQDQDVFNAAFYRYSKLLHPKYNTLLGAVMKVCRISDINALYGTRYANADELVDESVIWHWASGDKPWMSSRAPKAQVWQAT